MSEKVQRKRTSLRQAQGKLTSNTEHSTLNIECGAASRVISVDPSDTSQQVGTPVGMTRKKGALRQAQDKAGKKMKDRERKTVDGTCEDCEHSVPAGSAAQPTLICMKKAGAELPWQVVEAEEGCSNFERAREIVPLDIAEALAEGAKLIPLTQGKFAIVDAEDYEWLKQYKWHVDKGDSTYYATRSVCRRNIRMHREILNAPRHLLVDHIDHNGLNNRKSNLRLCTHKQNQRNRRPRRGGSSKYKGVYRHKSRKKFRAMIYDNGKLIHLGYFEDEIEAAKAYDKKARELFGEFAYLNFP